MFVAIFLFLGCKDSSFLLAGIGRQIVSLNAAHKKKPGSSAPGF